MNQLTLSNSQLRSWQKCKRNWMLAWEYGYSPDPSKESPAGVMHLGSAVHLALEAWYGYSIDPIQALIWSYGQDIADHPGETDRTKLEKELELAIVMTEGYLAWAAAEGVDAGITILGCEITVQHNITLPDGTPITLSARLDQLCQRESDGALLARDLKTVGSLGQAQKLRFSSQLVFYAMIQALKAKAEGGMNRIAGGEYLLISRSKRTSRATPPFYQRVEVPVSRSTLNATYMQTIAIATEIVETRKKLAAGEDHHVVAYPHFSDHCSWSCPFIQVCPLFDDGSRAWDMMDATFAKGDPYAYYSDGKISRLVAAMSAVVV